MNRYNTTEIEAKWQKIWDETKLYQAKEDNTRPKIYATPMLPYPSGTGLHVGHGRNYSIADAVARFHRQRGHNVMSNMGWDAFGLPTENYAMKANKTPQEATEENITNFKNQLKRFGMSYDWTREINTTDPEYYRWTQWIFTQLYKNGLAYRGESQQWWCTLCQTVLANEQVIDGKCWRHDDPDDPEVERRTTKQWFFKITDYADELLEGIDQLNWPERIKTAQRNWIGKSVGVELEFKLADSDQNFTVFTTRPDTLYGATYVVLAPEHDLVETITSDAQRKEVDAYVHEAKSKSELQRKQSEKDKTGVFTGAYAVNPLNDEKIPVWIADYVLSSYGTGAIMAVPAHDERDHEFAEKFNLPITRVIEGDELPYSGEGKLVNSGEYSGLPSAEAREKIVQDLQKDKLAKETTNYRMRDWLIGRQRYWGAPIPIIHCEDCGEVPVPESDLPVVLPVLKDFQPTGDAISPLAKAEDWLNVACPKCDKPAKRETDTMDGYACSSWYMYRYTDAQNSEKAWDPEKANYWFPVDFYFGGDHAVSHLLYFRFWHKFFVDQGYISKDYPEPVKSLVFNGYINAEDGAKMSKSKGNVIDPLEVIDSGYGADALRLYELFIGPYDQDVSWNTNGVPGTYRFLQRIWDFVQDFLSETEGKQAKASSNAKLVAEVTAAVHKAIKKVTEDLENLSFNTAIAAQMKLNNQLRELREQLSFAEAVDTWKQAIESSLAVLAPFAPHITEELWQQLGHDNSIHLDTWPAWDKDLVKDDLVTIVVQVNGKVRANITAPADTEKDDLIDMAKQENTVQKYLTDTEIIKTIVVPNKLVNFVTSVK